jgi:hypothetical protein
MIQTWPLSHGNFVKKVLLRARFKDENSSEFSKISLCFVLKLFLLTDFAITQAFVMYFFYVKW